MRILTLRREGRSTTVAVDGGECMVHFSGEQLWEESGLLAQLGTPLLS
jgi:hypothetical protein